MDEEVERLIIAVRADTTGFARDVEAMRGQLEGPLGEGVARAGNLIEASLARALRTGRLGFEDLRRVALSALSEIAASALASGIGALFGGGQGGLAGLASGLIGGLLGLPGRATGGPVSPGRAVLVGERGPEVFVPTSAGSVATLGAQPRDVRIAIAVNAPAATAPDMLARSSRQVARAVRRALAEED